MPLLFFVVLLAVWVAPTTNRISSFVDPKYLSYPLLLAVGATGSLRGFWNGVVFITIGMKERKRQKEIKRTGHAVR
jgi:prepilin signal peptidase PulO-like enzyme (type II secretory pathway)